MGVEIYDKALVSKIASVFPRVVYMKDNEVFKQEVIRNGKLEFPMVSVYRPTGYSLSSFNSSFHHYGLYEMTTVLGKRTSFRAVLVDLDYSIDVISNKREGLEELTSELLLFFFQRPYMDCELRSKALGKDFIRARLPLRASSGPEDISFIEEEENGRLYRYQFHVMVEQAWLFNTGDTLAGLMGRDEEGNLKASTEPIVQVESNVYVNTDDIPDYPVITADIPELRVGEEFSPSQYVTATDRIDGDISSALAFVFTGNPEVLSPGSVVYNHEGEYLVYCKVVNSRSIERIDAFRISVVKEDL